MKLEHSILSAKHTIKGCRWLPTCIYSCFSFIHVFFVIQPLLYNVKHETETKWNHSSSVIRCSSDKTADKLSERKTKVRTEKKKKSTCFSVTVESNSRLNVIPQERATGNSVCLCVCVCVLICWYTRRHCVMLTCGHFYSKKHKGKASPVKTPTETQSLTWAS